MGTQVFPVCVDSCTESIAVMLYLTQERMNRPFAHKTQVPSVCRFLSAALLVLFVCCIVSFPAFSAEQQKPEAAPKAPEAAAPQPSAPATDLQKKPEAAPAPAPKVEEGFDIVLLMDSSGSMKKTDPKDYRKEAAKLFVSLISERDNISIVSFGDSAQELAPLTAGGKADRAGLFKAVGKITSREMTTNIPEAVRLGFEILKKSKRQNRIMLLMSDGKIDLLDKDKDAAAAAELQKMLPEVATAGVKIYTVAFSELSDAALLRQMAEKTGGAFRYAQTDRDIHVVFSSIFERLKSPDTLALEGDTFLVDKDVKEAVLLINKLPGTATILYDPSGKRVVQGKIQRDIEWFGSKVFDMITIKEPAVGKWRIKLSTREGNKIFVLTDLKLKTTFAKDKVLKSDKIVLDAWIERDGLMIQNRDVLSQIGFFADLIEPDSVKQMIELKPTGKEGLFAIELPFRKAGDHTLLLHSGGKTFNRTREFKITVAEPPPPAQSVQPVQKPAALPLDEVNWQWVLMQFGMVNGVILGVVVIVFVTRKAAAALSARKKAAAAKKAEAQPEAEK